MGTKLTIKSFNSKLAPRRFFRNLEFDSIRSNTTERATVKYELRIFELLFCKRKEIPKIGKNGTKYDYGKSFNSKLRSKEFLKLGL